MHLDSSLSHSPRNRFSLQNTVDNLRNLTLATVLSASGIVSAEDSERLNLSPRPTPTTYASSQSTLDGTLIEPGHASHDSGISDALQGHVVFSSETLTGAILPNGEFASHDGVSSLEVDAFLQKKDMSAHLGVHDISPLDSDDDLEKEVATSFTLNYDSTPIHIAVGARHYHHSALHDHEHIHFHDDGHGHISEEITTIKETVQEEYIAALFQGGYDFGDHATLFIGTEWDLGERSGGTDFTHLTYAGTSFHGHAFDSDIGFRLMLAHSHGNNNEPDSTFLRPSLHIETPILEKLFHNKVHLILFGEGIIPLDNNRQGGIVGGAGLSIHF